MEVLAGYHCVREALRARRRRLSRLWIRTPVPRGGLELQTLAEAADVPVEWGPDSDLEARLPFDLRSQGLILEAGPLPEQDLATALAIPPEEQPLIVALDEVEDPQNVGAIARSAEAAGARALLLTRRRAPPSSPAVSRASAGAIEHLPVIRVPNLARALRELGERGHWRIGADGGSDAQPYWEAGPLWRSAAILVLGGEERGLRPAVRSELDLRIRIPMHGRVESLNVAAAAAVLLFDAVRNRSPAGIPSG